MRRSSTTITLATTDVVARRAPAPAAWIAPIVWAPLTTEMPRMWRVHPLSHYCLIADDGDTIIKDVEHVGPIPTSAVVFIELLTFLFAFRAPMKVTQIRTKQGTLVCLIEVKQYSAADRAMTNASHPSPVSLMYWAAWEIGVQGSSVICMEPSDVRCSVSIAVRPSSTTSTSHCWLISRPRTNSRVACNSALNIRRFVGVMGVCENERLLSYPCGEPSLNQLGLPRRIFSGISSIGCCKSHSSCGGLQVTGLIRGSSRA